MGTVGLLELLVILSIFAAIGLLSAVVLLKIGARTVFACLTAFVMLIPIVGTLLRRLSAFRHSRADEQYGNDSRT